MISRIVHFLVIAAGFSGMRLVAQDTVFWNSTPGAVNLTSTGSLMDSGYHFELGVFTGSFIPTPANVSDWAAAWKSARRTSYNSSTKRFADSFSAEDNAPPFTLGKSGYVWGFRGDALSGEWILFRASTWTWPDAASSPPSFFYWLASDATAVIGTIHSNGSPFLMQSASVSNAAPPATSWSQWQGEMLAGESRNGPGDDPDGDGVANLLEFIFGSAPLQSGPPPSTPTAIVESGGDDFLQLTLPRRVDHPASLTVEVSADLVHWQSGSSATVVVENSLAALVVRDLTPLGGENSKRFMRLKAALP